MLVEVYWLAVRVLLELTGSKPKESWARLLRVSRTRGEVLRQNVPSADPVFCCYSRLM